MTYAVTTVVIGQMTKASTLMRKLLSTPNANTLFFKHASTSSKGRRNNNRSATTHKEEVSTIQNR